MIGTGLLIGLTLLLGGANALALGDLDVSSSRASGLSQDVDIDDDDLLSALVLDADFEDIADIDRSSFFTSDFRRDVDLDEDDVFAALLLDDLGVRDWDDERLVVRVDDDDFDDLRWRSHVLDDDLFDAHDLDAFRFGTLGGFGILDDDLDLDDIADIDESRSVDVDLDRHVDLDEDDLLAALVLN